MRPTKARIALGAIRKNVETLVATAAPAAVCAVVKADAYGHGAVATARAAVDAGATWLAVALVDEGIELRTAGLKVPILVLSEPRPKEMVEVADHSLTPTVYTGAGLAAAEAAARAGNRPEPLGVHLKVDTGMHRVGAAVDAVDRLAAAIVEKPSLRLDAIWTHCAVADEPDLSATDEQLDLFDDIVAKLRTAGHTDFMTHAANSAVTLAHPRGMYDMVRCGIAVYGIAPSPALEGRVPLTPALSVVSEIAFLKAVKAGDRISYGLRHEFERDTVVATVPIGYADGVRRSYWRLGGDVLIRGKRRRVVGVVTMDQVMIDCGPEGDVEVGDEVVVLGAQQSDEIAAREIADKLGTISYEILCDVGRRVRRVYH